MSDPDDKNVKPGDKTPDLDTLPEDKKDPADGSQPDNKAELEALQQKIDSIEKNAKQDKEITVNMQSALKVEREKRQALQAKLDGKEVKKSKFDPDEMRNFQEALKESGIPTLKDIENLTTKKEQEGVTQKNNKVFQDFITKNVMIFGNNDDSTKEQDKNLKTFSGYINEYFDINTKTLGDVKNLSKKLDKALVDLKSKVSETESEAKGADEARAADKNNILLSIGSGGGAAPEEDKNWKYGTSKGKMLQLLKSQAGGGYSDKDAKELIKSAEER